MEARREAKYLLEQPKNEPVDKAKGEFAPKKDKNAPKVAYSKLPVSVLHKMRQTSNSDPKKYKTRDPRFDRESGTLNEGMMHKSYAFIEDV